jgi:hypothetical protein
MKTIQIYDKHYQECDVVMLPINKAKIGTIMKSTKLSSLHDDDIDKPIGSLIRNKNHAVTESNEYWRAQHLYILSNEEIKEGDWVYDKVLNIIFQTDKYTNLKYVNQTDYVKKVISTTDSNLKIYESETLASASGFSLKSEDILLSQIPQQFVEYYISEYNRGNVINKVLVEAELYHGINTSIAEINAISGDDSMNWKGIGDYRDYKIKLNQNNEISILTEQQVSPKQETPDKNTIYDKHYQECEYMKEVGCIKDICTCNTGPKRETLEEAANKFASQTKPENSFEEGLCVGKALGFIEGAKYQAERMYNREKVVELLTLAWATASAYGDNTDSDDCSSWIKENLK